MSHDEKTSPKNSWYLPQQIQKALKPQPKQLVIQLFNTHFTPQLMAMVAISKANEEQPVYFYGFEFNDNSPRDVATFYLRSLPQRMPLPY